MVSTPRLAESRPFCQAEIENLDVPVGSDLDVGRFEVPMNDPALVRRLQTLSKLSRDPNDLVERQWTDGESLGQSRTLDEFEHERPTPALSSRP